MKFTTSLSIFLGASAAVNAARPASEVFNRINKRQPVIEKASSEPFKHPRLQKRASPFLNNATQSEDTRIGVMGIQANRIRRQSSLSMEAPFLTFLSILASHTRVCYPSRAPPTRPENYSSGERHPVEVRCKSLTESSQVLPFKQPQRDKRDCSLVQRRTWMLVP